MSRRNRAIRREATPDPKFNNEMVGTFARYIMKDGKLSTAYTCVYDAFEIIGEKTKKDPLEVFEAAVRNVGPVLEVKGVRVGGGNYQVPFEVRGTRKQMLAFRWIRDAARSAKGSSMANRLAREIMSASEGEGSAMSKRADVQRQAEANKAFAHFARRGRKKSS